MGKNEQDIITNSHNTIERLHSWLNDNELHLNLNKTLFINFRFPGQKSRITSLKLNSTVLKPSPFTKFLGITISEDCFWNNHVEYLNKRLSSLYFAFIRLKNSVNTDVLLSLYFGRFHSLLEYGVIFWGGSSISLSTFRLQK